MLEILRARPPALRARLDLVRGAVDARLHPPTPSVVPGLAALAGGAAWTFVALEVLSQPVPPDWPGYLAESLAPAALAAAMLLVAVVGAWLRCGDEGGRLGVVALILAIAGHLAWSAALVAAAAGLAYGPATAVAQTAAAAGTILVGLLLVKVRGDLVAVLLLAAGAGLLIPGAWGWLAAGGAWLAVGAWMTRGRSRRPNPATVI